MVKYKDEIELEAANVQKENKVWKAYKKNLENYCWRPQICLLGIQKNEGWVRTFTQYFKSDRLHLYSLSSVFVCIIANK